MIDIEVGIASLGGYRFLGPCLRSIFEEDSPSLKFQVKVGFNGLDDNEVTRQMQSEFPQVEYFVYKNKLGYCTAYNLLMRGKQARYVLLLDDDTIVPKESLPKMTTFMDEHPEVGIAGCMTRNPDGSHQKSYALRSTLKSELLNALGLSSFWL